MRLLYLGGSTLLTEKGSDDDSFTSMALKKTDTVISDDHDSGS